MSTSISRPARLPVAGLTRAAVTDQLRAAGCVYAEQEAALLFESAGSPAELAVMLDRRVAGLPLEHVLGWVEFCGLRVAVDPGVFVPRRRTELLARRAAALARPGAAVVDLGCGSGAVGMAVAALAGAVRLHAADIDPAAVACARRNLAASGGRVHAGDLYEPLPHRLRGRVEVLVANVPYVPSSAVDLLPREARIHEPLVALDGGDDGLDVIRRVTQAAGDWLSPGGHLLLEAGTGQIPAVVAALTTAGLTPTVVTDEELGATIVIGRRGRARHPDRPDPGHAGGAGHDAVGMPSAGGGSGATEYSFTGPSASSVS
jgi:release factor glutamine methyltransferase